ncbi:MAG: cadmium-translocating P-type ATPase [Clostridia bacterium]|nr:cadmium-translocating P-type ATPase [Clostridia bacterium]
MKEHEECGCGCHEHEHKHDHCHEHRHEHEHEEHCHCHGEHHAHETDGCGCGHDHEREMSANEKRKAILRYVLGAIPVIIGFMGFIPFYIPLVCALVGYALFGFEVYRGMLAGFARKKIFTEFTLMCVATVGAFAIGEYADAAAVMYLYSLGETISSGAYARSKKNISELIEIAPESANLLCDGEIRTVRPEELDIGDLIIVRAGERVAVDAEVVDGGGSADTSSVTGESKPLELYAGVFCPSGSLLSDGSVTMRATRSYDNSVVARLKRAVEDARERKSSAEKKISAFAAVFTPIAFGVAALVFALGAVITGNVADWLKVAIMVLVVSCPCSLVLSVPLTYFAGMGNAASSGIVFRGGEVMDRMSKIGAVAFDKTGTITESGMTFDGVTTYSDMTEAEFLRLAHSVLIHSPHAAAISFCKAYDADSDICVSDVKNVGGRGMTCVADGKKVLFGNTKLMSENGIQAPENELTAIYGAYDGRLVGRLEFSSRVKGGMKNTVAYMKTLGVERICVISGDARASVENACAEIGIEEYYSSCAPDEKLAVFEKIQNEQRAKGKKNSFSAYCGDGLNDSAVIAVADVGIAMGGCGSALTVESADVVLMDDDPQKINTAIRISRRTSRVANANIALSLGIKIGVLILGLILGAMSLEIPIELAIVADVGAAVVAVLNSLRAAKKEKI